MDISTASPRQRGFQPVVLFIYLYHMPCLFLRSQNSLCLFLYFWNTLGAGLRWPVTFAWALQCDAEQM